MTGFGSSFFTLSTGALSGPDDGRTGRFLGGDNGALIFGKNDFLNTGFGRNLNLLFLFASTVR